MDDFVSAWDQGRRPHLPRDERAYKAISTFTTRAVAEEKARKYRLGRFIAELEVPDDVPMMGSGGHRDLEGTRPKQLIDYIVEVCECSEYD